MLKLKKIAVTGSLGVGKSTACSLLKELGGFTVSTDDIVHQLLISNKDCIQKVLDLLGQEIKVNDQIDRKKIADLVFSNKEKLQALEKILHPLVFKKMETLYKEACNEKKNSFFVVEIPLLFESAWEFFFDSVLVIVSSESICMSRAQKKGLSPIDYQARVKRLLSVEEKIRKADFIIYNDESIDKLKEKLIQTKKELEL